MPDLLIPDVSDCVLWTGARVGTRREYGSAWRDGTWWLIHRWAWVQSHGPLPDGWQVHHLCGNKLCYNVAHLEAMPQLEHLREHYETNGPTGIAKVHSEQERCVKGHPFDKQTARQRVCSTCHNERNRALYARKKAANA